jgi:hypothetical protein
MRLRLAAPALGLIEDRLGRISSLDLSTSHCKVWQLARRNDTMNLELTKDELRALDLALQTLLKQQEQIQRGHTAYREDVVLIGGVAGKVRNLYVKEKMGL